MDGHVIRNDWGENKVFKGGITEGNALNFQWIKHKQHREEGSYPEHSENENHSSS